MLAMESTEVFGAPAPEQPPPTVTPEPISEPAERKKSKKAGKRDKATAAEDASTEGGGDDQPA